MKQEFPIQTKIQLQEVVQQLQSKLQYKIILLKGNLGAGKTTFIKYLCKHLGVKELISSPTYSLVNEYEYAKGKIYHFDLYRLKDEEEIYDIGFWEYIDSGEYCLVEWPEKIENQLQEKYHEICIFNDLNKRTLIFDTK